MIKLYAKKHTLKKKNLNTGKLGTCDNYDVGGALDMPHFLVRFLGSFYFLAFFHVSKMKKKF